MGVDRLEVDLAREEEIAFAEIGERGERGRQSDPHRVLDEARLEMGVLDDEELIRPFQQLVDRRAHRAFDDRDEVVCVELAVGAHVERSSPALVVGGERDELEDPLDVAVLEAGLGRAVRQRDLGRGPARRDTR